MAHLDRAPRSESSLPPPARMLSSPVKRMHYVTGGPVSADGVDVTRPADHELLEHCLRGDFVYILTARQLGKSSLMYRTVEALQTRDCKAVVLDLQAMGKPESAEQWYRGLLLEIENSLELSVDAKRWWNEHADLGYAHRFTLFLREVVAASTDQRVVIFVDEIDTTLKLDFTDDFFIAIRYLYGARVEHPCLERLSFVLIGVATPSDLIKDGQRTPFNIGSRVEMTDFTLEEAEDLSLGLQLTDAERRPVLQRILYWTGGHPYLTLSTFASLRDSPPNDWSDGSIDGRIHELYFGDAGKVEHNLHFVRSMLTDKLADAASTRNAVLQILCAVPWSRRPSQQTRSGHELA